MPDRYVVTASKKTLYFSHLVLGSNAWNCIFATP